MVNKGCHVIEYNALTYTMPYQLPFTPFILFLTHQQQTAFENIVGKKEIARNEQFLLFTQCFLLNQKIVSQISNIYVLIHSHTMTPFDAPGKQAF